MSRTTRQRVDDAFDPETLATFGQKYLELLYASWAGVVHNLRRTVFLTLILAMSFFLLDHAKSGELALGPLKTSNIAAVLTLIPAVTSFLLFEAIDLTIAGSYYQDTATALIGKLYPPVYKNDLEFLLEPTTTFAWGAGSTASLKPRSDGKIKETLDIAAVVAILGTVCAVLGFLAYAYLELYRSDHTNLFTVSASLLFTIFNVSRATLLSVDFFTSEE